MKILTFVLALLVAAPVLAQNYQDSVTVQGPQPGNTTLVTNPMPVGMKDAGGKVQAVSASNPLPVSGTITATTGGLTDTQLRATAVPVSGTVSVGGGAAAGAAPTLPPVMVSGSDYGSGCSGGACKQTVKTDATGNLYMLQGSTAPYLVNPAPQTGMACTEQCVTNSAGGTTISVPANSVVMWLKNLGPNPATCTYSGATPVALTTGDTLTGWGAGATDPIDSTPQMPIKASTITLKCIAATAAQSSGHCLQACFAQ